MNFDYWKGELSIYQGESVEDSEICMIADTKASPVTICVEPEWEIKIKKIEGREYITLHRKESKTEE